VEGGNAILARHRNFILSSHEHRTQEESSTQEQHACMFLLATLSASLGGFLRNLETAVPSGAHLVHALALVHSRNPNSQQASSCVCVWGEGEKHKPSFPMAWSYSSSSLKLRGSSPAAMTLGYLLLCAANSSCDVRWLVGCCVCAARVGLLFRLFFFVYGGCGFSRVGDQRVESSSERRQVGNDTTDPLAARTRHALAMSTRRINSSSSEEDDFDRHVQVISSSSLSGTRYPSSELDSLLHARESQDHGKLSVADGSGFQNNNGSIRYSEGAEFFQEGEEKALEDAIAFDSAVEVYDSHGHKIALQSVPQAIMNILKVGEWDRVCSFG
jgi:hypothetical protein